MRAVEVPAPGEGFELVERDVPEPGPESVRIEVSACGICGGDTAVTEGRPPIDYPRVPGHEVAGRVDAVGDRVSEWSVGDRVAVGWHGGHCFTCDPCRRGAFVNCTDRHVTGVLGDGGLAEFTTARREALVAVPDAVDATAAGPLVCAGMTAHNALRNSDARAGDRVAVLGLGGVGHLGVAFAAAAGYETVACSRGTDKREAAFELGADEFVDWAATDPAAALRDLGGAEAVLATAPSSDAVEAVVGGLAPGGELLVVGAPDDPAEFDLARLLGNRWRVQGWASGHAADAEDTLALAARAGIEPRVETYPLAEADRAFERFRAGEVRFRAVLEP